MTDEEFNALPEITENQIIGYIEAGYYLTIESRKVDAISKDVQNDSKNTRGSE